MQYVRMLELDEFKGLLNISGTGDDDLLGKLLDWNTDRLLKYMSLSVKEERVDTLWGGLNTVYVKSPPIVEGSDVTVYELRVGEKKKVDSDELIIDRVEGRVTNKRIAFEEMPFPSVEVTYEGGLAIEEKTNADGEVVQRILTDISPQVKKACYIQTRYEYKNRDTIGLRGFEVGDATINLAPAELLPEVEAIVRNELGNRLYVG